MVVKLEERIAAIASPELLGDGGTERRVCTATHEGNRYIFYGVDATLVILHESHAGAITNNPRSEAKRVSQFDLWQVWTASDAVKCVRFNTTSKRVAQGALALCLDDGRVILLTPSSSVSHLTTAVPPSPVARTRTASRLAIKTSDVELKPVSSSSATRRSSLYGSGATKATTSDTTSEYVKLHLQLQLPTWHESIRWKADDDRFIDRVEWAEAGDDVWLVGAGERITTWKVVEESGVVAYQQLSFMLGDPDQRVWRMDVTATGRFAATSGRHDRVLKLWSLGELAHDGTPVCSYLPHKRAIVATVWARPYHAFKIQGNQASQPGACEMLFILDQSGAVSIWREHIASPNRSFTLWKTFRPQDFLMQSTFGDVAAGTDASEAEVSPLNALVLVVNDWARPLPKPATGFADVLLDEGTVMSALSQFHYGYTSLDEVRRNALQNQRMDGVSKANAKLLGARSGMDADSHFGEALIVGNTPLPKTFLVNLVLGIHENGDLSLYRIESVPFAVSAPRVTLICMFSGLRAQLSSAHVYTASTADYKDRDAGFSSFLLELAYQPEGPETQLKTARLKLQAEGGGSRSSRSSMTFSVQMCESGDASASLLPAFERNQAATSITFSRIESAQMTSTSDVVMVSGGEDTTIFRGGSSLGGPRVGCRSHELLPQVSTNKVHSVVWPSRGIVFTFTSGKIHAVSLSPETSAPFGTTAFPSPSITTKLLFSEDEDGEDADIYQLIVCGVSVSQKKNWSSAPTSIFFSAPVSAEPSVIKDFCMLLALKTDRKSLIVWVFSVDPKSPADGDPVEGGAVVQLESSTLKLFRRVTVDVPGNRELKCIAPATSFDAVESLFVSVDGTNDILSLWGFSDMDDLSTLNCVHATPVASLLRGAASPSSTQENLQFFSTQTSYVFSELAVSACGRAALLFDEQAPESRTAAARSSALCIVSLFDTWHESVVLLDQKKFGQVLSIKWTQPVAPTQDCQLVVLTPSTILIVAIDSASDDGQWSVSWASTRLSVKPQTLSDMTTFPRAAIALNAGVSHLNLNDLMGYVQPSSSHTAAADVANSVTQPLSLLFLLMRGSFLSLDRAVAHVKQSIEEHEKTCYLKMQDDQELRKLPLLPLSVLLGQQDAPEERSATFTKGKGPSSSSSSSSSSVVSKRGSLARASDLFAMDFGSVRRSSLSVGIDLNGNLDSLFNTPVDGASEETRLSIETAEAHAFFLEHKASLPFLSEELRDVFLGVVSGCKKLVAWDKDGSRSKDEPTLRFAASLLWPFKATPETAKPTADSSGNESEPVDEDEANEVCAAAASIGICSEQVAWAVLSDHQADLLQECFPAPTMAMQDLTQLRLPFWLKSHAKLAQFAEKAAQAEYASTRDPFKVVLLYILLGKTKLLVSLFKLGNESKIAELLGNDFTDARWKNAAVKNAYVLKAKRRHELSAAFFLLGGRVQEAMSVAEHADRTLVLSFLIARLSEKWDLGGTSDGGGDGFGAGFADASFTGLSTSLRTFSAIRITGNEAGTDSFKDVCKEYLKSTVWTKAQACGDVYMQFIVKHLLGETTAAIQALLTIPEGDVASVFESKLVLNDTRDHPARRTYWRVFGQSLLGAAELVRYLKSTVPRMTSTMKLQAMHVQAVALNRLFAMGFNTIALYHQRDLATQFKTFCKENLPQSSAVRGALLAVRNRILISVMSGQAIKLSNTASKALTASLAASKIAASRTSSSAVSTAVRRFEDTIKSELECLVKCGGDYTVEDLPQTAEAATEAALKAAVLDTLRQSGRTAIEDFLFHQWCHTHSYSRASPLAALLETVVDGVACVASGDLVSSALTTFHSKNIDEMCETLLNVAEKLLCWLMYFFHAKRPEHSGDMNAHGSVEFVRVATAAVYSIIVVCSRYVKSPCCVHRALTAVFPHLEPLPKKTIDELKEIAITEVCVHCSAAKATDQPTTSLTSSLQRDVPVLYQTVQMLRRNLHLVVEQVRTNRLELTPPTLFYSYCQYWTLTLCMSATRMPAHIAKVAVDGANPHSVGTGIARRLVQSWSTFAANLAKYSSRMVLSELTESYFRPFKNGRAPSTPTGSTPVSPREGNVSNNNSNNQGATASSTTGTASAVPSPSTMAAVLSPRTRDRRESRQLLRCTCDRCPWLLVLMMFADKDELLLRINSQLECCGEKIKEEISWGHLPDFPSRKAALTRSQKILLSAAAAGKGSEVSDMLEKRMLQSSPSIQLDAHCIYRSEVSIKSLCFNRATETTEMILCSSRGLARTASVEYSDGTKYQFKGMYTCPQPSFFGEGALPTARRKTSDMSALARSSADSPQRGAMDGAGGGDAKTPSFKPTAIESHPFLPLFMSGNQKGKVHLWSYDSLSSVCEFQTRDVVATYPLGQAMSSRRNIKKIHFDSLGQQMGAVDSLGRLFMWKFANLDRDPCYRELDCHDKGAKALQFINSSSIVATAGSSSDKRSVCMWDLLLPNSKALVAAPVCQPAGAASLTFSPTHQLLISGGEGGSISVFDVRQRRVLHTITNAHETAITTLELHPSGRCVLSGSASGDVKIWSLPIFRELVAVSKVHAKPSFLGDAASNILGDAASNMAINVTSSSWGVTDAFATDNFFFTSGTDGSVQRFRVPSLGVL